MSFDFYKPSFFSKFLESHIVMAEVSITITTTSLHACRVCMYFYKKCLNLIELVPTPTSWSCPKYVVAEFDVKQLGVATLLV